MILRRTLLLASGYALVGCTATKGSEADPATKRQQIDAAVDGALANLYAKAPGSQELVHKSVGVLVMPKVLSAGFVIGGSYGQGALRKHGVTTSYYSVGAGSVGLLAGAEEKSIYMLFMNDEVLTKFEEQARLGPPARTRAWRWPTWRGGAHRHQDRAAAHHRVRHLQCRTDGQPEPRRHAVQQAGSLAPGNGRPAPRQTCARGSPHRFIASPPSPSDAARARAGPGARRCLPSQRPQRPPWPPRLSQRPHPGPRPRRAGDPRSLPRSLGRRRARRGARRRAAGARGVARAGRLHHRHEHGLHRRRRVRLGDVARPDGEDRSSRGRRACSSPSCPCARKRAVRLKRDDTSILSPLEIGVKDGDLLLPKGFVLRRAAGERAARPQQGARRPALRRAAPSPSCRRHRPGERQARRVLRGRARRGDAREHVGARRYRSRAHRQPPARRWRPDRQPADRRPARDGRGRRHRGEPRHAADAPGAAHLRAGRHRPDGQHPHRAERAGLAREPQARRHPGAARARRLLGRRLRPPAADHSHRRSRGLQGGPTGSRPTPSRRTSTRPGRRDARPARRSRSARSTRSASPRRPTSTPRSRAR